MRRYNNIIHAQIKIYESRGLSLSITMIWIQVKIIIDLSCWWKRGITTAVNLQNCIYSSRLAFVRLSFYSPRQPSQIQIPLRCSTFSSRHFLRSRCNRKMRKNKSTTHFHECFINIYGGREKEHTIFNILQLIIVRSYFYQPLWF